METFLDFAGRKRKTMFKSYYVVWKHEKAVMLGAGAVWFKSYYVVWKLPASG